jgi:hypothetical protein
MHACREEKGLPKLQQLFVGMFELDKDKRLSAMDVVRCLNDILHDFPTML